MNHSIKPFDHYHNHDVLEYRLTNKNGVSISCLDQGALWHTFDVPTSNNRTKNIILSFPKIHDYYANTFYVGMAIGRTAVRIRNGQALINNKLVQLSQNEGNNYLHGGLSGFSTYLWSGKIVDNKIVFSLHIPSLSDSFPGALDTTLTYELTERNEVILTFSGESDEATLFNPTTHVYFNLNDTDTTILNHDLTINSHHKLNLDNEKIPTDKLDALVNTPYNFSQPTKLLTAINELQTIPEKGIDDVYFLDSHDVATPITTLSSVETNRKLSIFSKRNGLVVYSGNAIANELPLLERTSQQYVGIALEAVTLPNSVSNKNFGDITLPAKKNKTYKIKYDLTF